MNENTKSIAAASVILGCLAFLAFLVHEKVDGSLVLALSVVPTLIAYFTRPPDRRDPPSGIAVLAGVATLLSAIASCATFQEKQFAAEQAYREQQRACVRQYDTDERINACRARVRKEWGFVEVVTDGGAQ